MSCVVKKVLFHEITSALLIDSIFAMNPKGHRFFVALNVNFLFFMIIPFYKPTEYATVFLSGKWMAPKEKPVQNL